MYGTFEYIDIQTTIMMYTSTTTTSHQNNNLQPVKKIEQMCEHAKVVLWMLKVSESSLEWALHPNSSSDEQDSIFWNQDANQKQTEMMREKGKQLWQGEGAKKYLDSKLVLMKPHFDAWSFFQDEVKQVWTMFVVRSKRCFEHQGHAPKLARWN